MTTRIPTMISRSLFPLLLAAAGTGACQDAPHVAPIGDTKVAVTTVAKGLEHPWSLAFLPDGRMLVTERPGRLRYVTPDGALSDGRPFFDMTHAPEDPDIALDGTTRLAYVAAYGAAADEGLRDPGHAVGAAASGPLRARVVARGVGGQRDRRFSTNPRGTRGVDISAGPLAQSRVARRD